MREADDARLAKLAADHLAGMIERPLEPEDEALLLSAMPALKPRAKNLIELAEGALFLFDSVPLAFEDKAQALMDAAPEGLLPAMAETLDALPDWTMESLEAAVRAEAEARALGLGKVAQPLRAALTGRAVSPGIFDVLFLLGRAESLQRIGSAQRT
jgi:glutamyl-tRNA synthetase